MKIEELKQHRDDIIKAEIGSLFFNLGKTHIGINNWKNYFEDVESKFSSYKEYYKQNYFENELNAINPKLKDFLSNTKVCTPLEGLVEWIEFFKGDTSKKKIVKKVFFQGCENINSGIDKGNPKEQFKGKLWISNAFGTWKEDVCEENFDARRECFFKKLNEWYVKQKYVNWQELREFILREIKAWYSHLLSDSRYPANDVTLYEQAYMSSSMFKASLASMYLDTDVSKNYVKEPRKIRWKILAIQYDKLSLSEKALRPGHIAFYRNASKEVENKIKHIIEIEYALGNEIYRDETGIYFLVAEGIEEKHLLENEGISSQIMKCFQKVFEDEVYPHIELSKANRGLMHLTNLLEKAKENFLDVNYSLLKDAYKPAKNIQISYTGICQICNVRLVSQKDKKDLKDVLVCDLCNKRKEKRLDAWKKNQAGETIWITELADKNNRVALVSVKFELKEWLNGNLFSSILINRLKNEDTYDRLIKNIKTGLQKDTKIRQSSLKEYGGDIPDLSLKELAETFLIERSIDSAWEKYLNSDKKIIKFEKREIDWGKMDDSFLEKMAKTILQFLLRKNPSPARLKRVWNTTEDFFHSVKTDILDTLIKRRTKESFENDVPDYKDINVKKIDYKAYFSITNISPISWQFCIPTNKLDEVIENIQNLYYENFSYVDGKLPLHIGVIAQNSKLPLYIGIKALRNIRRDVKSWNDLQKISTLKNLDCKHKTIEINNKASEYYSLYETDASEYDFALLPSSKGVARYNDIDKFIIYPNTIDFEFLDTNNRRNDIIYENGSRKITLKENRPYTWQEWEKFKNFKTKFKDKSNLLQHLVSVIYTKMTDWQNNEDSFKIFMDTMFKKENIPMSEFGIEDYSFKEIKKILDMFAYYHTTLKEI